MNSSGYCIVLVLTIAIFASSSSTTTSVRITASSESNNNKCYSGIFHRFPTISNSAKSIIYSVCEDRITELNQVQSICTNAEMHAFSIALTQNTQLKSLSFNEPNCNPDPTIDVEGIQYLVAGLHENTHLESFSYQADSSAIVWKPLVENFGCFNIKTFSFQGLLPTFETATVERISQQLGGSIFPLQNIAQLSYLNVEQDMDYISRGLGNNSCLRTLFLGDSFQTSQTSISNESVQLLAQELIKTHSIEKLSLPISPALSSYLKQLLTKNYGYPCYLKVISTTWNSGAGFTIDNKPRCNVNPKCLQPSTQTCSNLIPLTLPPSNNNNGLNSPTTSKGLLIGLIVAGVIAVVLAALLIVIKIRKEKQQEEAGGGKYQEINNQ